MFTSPLNRGHDSTVVPAVLNEIAGSSSSFRRIIITHGQLENLLEEDEG